MMSCGLIEIVIVGNCFCIKKILGTQFKYHIKFYVLNTALQPNLSYRFYSFVYKYNGKLVYTIELNVVISFLILDMFGFPNYSMGKVIYISFDFTNSIWDVRV